MKNFLKKIRQWWDEQPTYEKEIQAFLEAREQSKKELFEKYEKMSEKELLIEIAKNTSGL